MALHDPAIKNDLTRKLSLDLDQTIEIVPFDGAGLESEIPDSTSKFLVLTKTGRRFFLIVSGEGNKRIMSRSVRNIQTVCNTVRPEIAEHVLRPIATGDLHELSYAAWPEKRPFPTAGRLQRYLARTRYAKPILDWSDALTFETLKDGDPETFLTDLQVICDDQHFTRQMRNDAYTAIARLQSNQFSPKNSMQHGDFWTGNILFPTGPNEPQFYVIDWPSALVDGYPFLDLTRMLISLRASSRFCAERYEKLRREIGCDHCDIMAFVLSGLGNIGRNLEYFPPSLYRQMAASVYDLAKKIS